ncbi:MAG: Jag N-terminal domain-containing protein, partial [Desulfovibrio sp.]|nr:Jag N-terminal domain-containing protein [Desulfovibrio sp.]
MEKFKNFQGRTLDEAILEACGYYGVPREKLEIEIVNDAKSGIFGLVGVKKAEIRAARMQVAETLSAMLEDADAGAGTATSPPGSAPAPAGGKTPGRGGRLRGSRSAGHGADKGSTSVQETGRATPPARASSAKATPPVRDPAEMGAPSGQETGNAVPPSRDFSSHAAPPARDLSGSAGQARSAERGAFPASAVEEPDPPRPERGRSESDAEASGDEVGEYDAGSRVPTPEFDPASMDPEKLTDIVRSVVVGLAAPIVGDVPCRVDIGERWVRAVLDCGGNAGLLVGREGQTLAALQYLAG